MKKPITIKRIMEFLEYCIFECEKGTRINYQFYKKKYKVNHKVLSKLLGLYGLKPFKGTSMWVKVDRFEKLYINLLHYKCILIVLDEN